MNKLCCFIFVQIKRPERKKKVLREGGRERTKRNSRTEKKEERKIAHYTHTMHSAHCARTHTHTHARIPLWKFSKPEHTDKTRLNGSMCAVCAGSYVYDECTVKTIVSIDRRQCRQCRLVCLSRIYLNMYDN